MVKGLLRSLAAAAALVIGLVASDVQVDKAFIVDIPVAEAHHNYRLPVIPNTPVIRDALWEYGAISYCLNPRASAYPGFRAQIQEVMSSYAQLTGVPTYEVPWGNPWGIGPESSQTGCNVQHNMPDNPNFCSGCAANVTYANWPVVIQYKWTLGYSDWRSAIAHEFGHVLGLHEQYQDLGSIQCTNRSDTVMDCGYPYVNKPQPLDISRLKEWLYPQPTTHGFVSYDGQNPFAWWLVDQFRADQGAVMYYDPWSAAYYWSGIVRWGQDADGYARVYIYCVSGREIWVNQQNSNWPASYITPNVRNDTYLYTC